VTKGIHNGLQGSDKPLSAKEQAIYLKTAEENARMLEED
jgi:hypothetical protein